MAPSTMRPCTRLCRKCCPQRGNTSSRTSAPTGVLGNPTVPWPRVRGTCARARARITHIGASIESISSPARSRVSQYAACLSLNNYGDRSNGTRAPGSSCAKKTTHLVLDIIKDRQPRKIFDTESTEGLRWALVGPRIMEERWCYRPPARSIISI